MTRDWQNGNWNAWKVGERDGFDEEVSRVMVKLLRHKCKGISRGYHHVEMDTGGWARIQDVVRTATTALELRRFQGEMKGVVWHSAVNEMVMISLGVKEKVKEGGKGFKARYQLAVEAVDEYKTRPLMAGTHSGYRPW